MRPTIFTTSKNASTVFMEHFTKRSDDYEPRLLPSIIATDLRPSFPIFSSSSGSSWPLRSLIASKEKDYKRYNRLGFHYFPEALSFSDERNILDRVSLYALKGMQCEHDHFIQRENERLQIHASFRTKILSLIRPIFDDLQQLKQKYRVHSFDSFNEKQDEIANENCAMDETPSFNYYDKPHLGFRPHIDNVFLAESVAVVSLYQHCILHFKHWTSGHEFSVCIEPQSVYVMTKELRFDYTHEIKPLNEHCFTPLFGPLSRTSSLDLPRVSLVYGINRTGVQYQNSIGQIWGESEQRKMIDEFMQRKLTFEQYMQFLIVHAFKGERILLPFLPLIQDLQRHARIFKEEK